MLLHNPSRPSCNAGVLPSTPSRNSSCNAQNCSLQNYGARTYQSTSAQIKKTPGQLRPGDFCSVELTGFEPVTPTLPVWCATSCAIAPKHLATEAPERRFPQRPVRTCYRVPAVPNSLQIACSKQKTLEERTNCESSSRAPATSAIPHYQKQLTD